jgi:hypothetical protein
MADTRRFWDATVLRAWFDGSADADVQAIIRIARGGEAKIFVSSLSMLEATGDDWRTLNEAARLAIYDFFRHSFIGVMELHRAMAEFAWDLMEELSSARLSHSQAVQLATAYHAKVTVFETYDADLLALPREVGTRLRFRIQRPDLRERRQLELPNIDDLSPANRTTPTLPSGSVNDSAVETTDDVTQTAQEQDAIETPVDSQVVRSAEASVIDKRAAKQGRKQ